jgi:hypothetical protein
MFVADAVGKGSQSAHLTAIERMAHPGAVPNTTLAAVTELFRDWTSPPADKVRAVIYCYFAEVSKVTTEVGVWAMLPRLSPRINSLRSTTGNGCAAVITHAGDARGRVWSLSDTDKRQDLGDAPRIQRVTIRTNRTNLKDQEQACYAANLKRDTPLRMPRAAWFSPSIACPDWRSDSTVC